MKSNGTILSVKRSTGGNGLTALEINPTNGVINVVNSESLSQWSYYSPQGLILDNSDNIYISGRKSSDYSRANLVKFNSEFNEVWDMELVKDQGGSQDASIRNLVYDSTNNLIYISGNAYLADMNPLGEENIPTNYTTNGAFFAAYNTDGILQLVHLFDGSTTNTGSANKLEILDNKLFIRGYFNGAIDFDVTTNDYYSTIAGNVANRYMSIYDLQNGLEITGHYYTGYNLSLIHI